MQILFGHLIEVIGFNLFKLKYKLYTFTSSTENKHVPLSDDEKFHGHCANASMREHGVHYFGSEGLPH